MHGGEMFFLVAKSIVCSDPKIDATTLANKLLVAPIVEAVALPLEFQTHPGQRNQRYEAPR